MTKNIAHSIQVRLLNLSKEIGVPYQQTVTRYLQERILCRLSHSVYVDNFILKGGALLYAHVREAARPTLDLDFMGERISRERDSLLRAFREIYEIEENDGVKFASETLTTEEIAVDKKYPGLRMSILATLGTIRQVVSMDIGFGDVIVPAPVSLDYPALLDEDNDIRIKAYSVETVIAEKLQTMVDRYTSNSRMKDFHDVWMLLENGNFNPDQLSESIVATFANRKTDTNGIASLFTAEFVDNEELNQRWNAYGRKAKIALPTFRELMDSIKNGLSDTANPEKLLTLRVQL